MKKSELVALVMEIIKHYYEAEKQNILASDCCHSDTLQALADECHGLFNGFLSLLE